jgi:hypothetical protein
MSLPKQVQKIKGFFRFHEGHLATILHILLLAGVGSGGYLLGLENAPKTASHGVAVYSPRTEPLPSPEALSMASVGSAVDSDKATKGYIASKNGTKYHRIDCPGARTIKESNKVYFASEDEARKAGYAPASNCPGLQK